MARRKIKKVSGEGGHGGSWKVAYADFMTAMMAFFLLMWLINMVPSETKETLEAYFKDYSVFDREGGSWMAATQGSSPGVTMQTPPEAPPGEEEPVQSQPLPGADQQDFKDALEEDIHKSLQGMEDQLIIENIAGGIRIQIVDKTGNPIFAVNSSELNENGKKILSLVGSHIKSLGQKVAVEGHSDSMAYSSNRMTNWDLSTNRASAARRSLEQEGLSPDCIMRVTGYAATQPYIKDMPADPRNRRISILLYSNSPCVVPGIRREVRPGTPQPPSYRPSPNPLAPSSNMDAGAGAGGNR
ncbi:MAG: OmpA family protein [Desulfarculales bacterium]|jgi:chemotaxis protein MotB|nr:OmpA family protein [Desulfarculales bacterium]